MKIKIAYESKYSLATTKNGENILTGMAVITADSNKSAKDLFKKENTFLENVKELNKFYPNYQYADITQNTVLGILCRLVGEVRRLDTLDETHPIIALKDKISFKNVNTEFQNETVLLHTPLKEVQNNAGGLIPEEKSGHFLLTRNPLSETLLSVFKIETQEEMLSLLEGMKNNDKSLFYSKYPDDIKANTFVKEMSLADNKNAEIIEGFLFKDGDCLWKEVNGRLFRGPVAGVLALEEDIAENLDNKAFNVTNRRKELDVDEIFNIFGAVFALKIAFLRKNELFEKEFENSLNGAKTSIKGLAPGSGSITIKDFYVNFVTDKKMSWTMPYSVDLRRDLFVKEDLKEFNTFAKLGVTKECGYLEISIDISEDDALDLFNRIDEAGVNTFHLGKKGLAYIEEISLE